MPNENSSAPLKTTEMENPKLPHAALWRDALGFRGYADDPGQGPWFTVDQMHAYATQAVAAQAPAAVAVPASCQACGYQHGHRIGCERNPVDIGLKAGATSLRTFLDAAKSAGITHMPGAKELAALFDQPEVQAQPAGANVREAVADLAAALDMFVGNNPRHSLCQQEAMDVLGRVKGTWSAAAEANAKSTLKLHASAIAALATTQPSTDELNCVCGTTWFRHGKNNYEMVATPRNTPQPSPAEEYPALPLLIAPDEIAALSRFDECARDGQGYDVPNAMMKKLASIGLVRHITAGVYEHTDFGLSVLHGSYADATHAMRAGSDIKCKSEQKRLATLWGFVPAAAAGEQEQVADSFSEWFAKNYPTDTIILDPDWHARSIYRMAMAHARLTSPVATHGEQDAKRYRYLRDNCVREWVSRLEQSKGAKTLDIDFNADGHDLDAAIDAVLSATPKEPA